MRIVVVGIERSDPLMETLAAVRGSVLVAGTSPTEVGAALRAADVMVLGPACIESGGVVETLRAIRQLDASIPVLAIGREDRAALAVALMKAGATDYAIAGVDDIAEVVRALANTATPPAVHDASVPGLVGSCHAMAEVRALVRIAALADAPVLLEGDTGTGKEVVARAIHALGRRATRPFVPINCAAVPETLAESEFFGHTRGAFTGAVQEHPGALRQADGGILFLDEIEDLSLSLQAKLLRVVQDREVRPLGSSTTRRVDVRIVAASNRDLWQMVESGRFRSDLYYRLRVLAIRLPPLRERRDDLPVLIAHFVHRFNEQHRAAFVLPGPLALRPLLEHTWPGNVRELENTLEAVLTVAHATGIDLSQALRNDPPGGRSFWADERTRLLRVLESNRWNRQRAAAALGISRVTLWRRMGRHQIRDPFEPIAETA
jgi:DNA-binding NtrC family response regulator